MTVKKSLTRGSCLLLKILLLLAITPGDVLAVIPFMDDNLSECNSKVQSSIKNLHSNKGVFSIHCEKGFLERISASRNSPVFLESPSEFVNNHWELFLASAPKSQLEFKYESDQAGQMYRQQYEGFPLPNGFARKFYPWWPTEKTLEYQFLIVDTSAWEFKPKLRLNCAKAVELAKKQDEEKGIAKDLNYLCVSTEAVISLNSFPDGPSLIWAVKARKPQMLLPPIPLQGYDVRVFHVDANSGRINTFTITHSNINNGWPRAGGPPK